MKEIAANLRLVHEIDLKTTSAVHSMGQVTRGMAQYSDLDTRLNQFVGVDQGKNQKIEAEFLGIKFKDKLTDELIRNTERQVQKNTRDVAGLMSQKAEI